MVRIISNAEMVEDEEREAAEEDQRRIQMFTDQLSGRIRSQWETNRTYKNVVEQTLEQCRRARNNEYDPDIQREIAATQGSDIFLPLTQMQCIAASAWLSDILMPSNDKSWSLSPTPEPDLPADVIDRLKTKFQGEVDQARTQGVEPDPKDMKKRAQGMKDQEFAAVQEMARESADRMETRIEDQLVESGWDDAFEQFIDDFVTYPCAFIETTYRRKPKLKWANGQPIVSVEVCEKDERLSPYDVFPSPGQVGINDGDMVIRKRMSRDGLYSLIGTPGYDEEKVRQVLAEFEGSYSNHGVGVFEDHSTSQNLTDSDGMILALHYWGSAQGLELLEWGMSVELIDDPMREYQIEAIQIGTHVIKVKLNSDPLMRRPYYKASYRNKPGHFWGIAIPQLVRGHQRMANAATRALSNNMGVSSGPQVVIDVDQLPDGEALTHIYPWKVWQMTGGAGATPSQSPVQFYQPGSNANELLAVLNQFWEQAADVTGISKMAYGVDRRIQQGAETATGMAILQENSAKTIKEAVRHIDRGITEPRITRQFQMNMLFDPDMSIKGDIRVVARGSSALIAKASTQAKRNEFMAATNNETDQQIIGLEGRIDMLRAMVNDLDLDVDIPEAEVIMEKMQGQSQQQETDPAVQKEMIRKESRLQDQQMEMQDRERERQLKLMLAQLDDGREREKFQIEYQKAVQNAQAIYERAIIAAQNKRQVIADEAEVKRIYGSGV